MKVLTAHEAIKGTRLGVDHLDCGFQSGLKTKYKCDYCGKDFVHYGSEIYYKNGKDKIFCSWTCKCRYNKEHKKE